MARDSSIRVHADLSAGLDHLPPEPGLVIASARSDGVGTVPGRRSVLECNEFEAVPQMPPTVTSKRQRKRKRDTNRKKKLYNETFELRGLINKREKENVGMEEEIMTLKAQKALLTR